MKEPKNNYEAYKLGLELSITAPTEEKSKEAIKLTASLEKSLSELEIARAKKEVGEKIMK